MTESEEYLTDLHNHLQGAHRWTTDDELRRIASADSSEELDALHTAEHINNTHLGHSEFDLSYENEEGPSHREAAAKTAVSRAHDWDHQNNRCPTGEHNYEYGCLFGIVNPEDGNRWTGE